jgi:hypothetical protein
MIKSAQSTLNANWAKLSPAQREREISRVRAVRQMLEAKRKP